MDFGKKLQQLRTQSSLTQEQLAEQLYVSRTAISKWESGKGYPSIESLKCISRFFSVSIDELLSGEELITLAQTETHSHLKKLYGILSAILDLMCVGFIVLPLYGNSDGRYIHAVNLISYTDTSAIHLAVYWAAFLIFIFLGAAKLAFTHFEKERLGGIVTKSSLILNAVTVCFFAAAREPYATALSFLLFVAKMLIFGKQRQIK